MHQYLCFHETHGQTFRRRMKSKALSFCHLVSRGLVREPTGFFVAAVRRNWLRSKGYEPGKKVSGKVRPKATAGAGESATAWPAVGSVVQVLGDLGRDCRVVWHRLVGGEWRSMVEELLNGAESVVASCKLRPSL